MPDLTEKELDQAQGCVDIIKFKEKDADPMLFSPARMIAEVVERMITEIRRGRSRSQNIRVKPGMSYDSQHSMYDYAIVELIVGVRGFTHSTTSMTPADADRVAAEVAEDLGVEVST